MRKITILLFLLFSFVSFSQQNTTMHKASNVTTTLYGDENSSSENTDKSSTIDIEAKGESVNGSIVADLSVSGSGGVNYTVPINVVPGLNGVQPDIALTFDSQSGNGLAGWGWNISGVSVITRIPTTKFHDNFIDPVDFDLNDRFALNGQRLMVKTGNYGTNESVYETENYSNTKIVAYGTHPSSNVQGPKYFKAFYPDGSKAVYGYTDNSRSYTDYAISYYENPQGIRISYTYTTSKNTLYLKTIKYGSKGTDPTVNEVTFSYGNREFIETAYIGGIQFVKDKILGSIIVRGSGGTKHRTYFLAYNKSSVRYSRLNYLIETESTPGNDSTSRRIDFTYDGSNANDFSVLSGLIEKKGIAARLDLSNASYENANVVPLDYTGDGKMDFVLYPTLGPDTNKKLYLFTGLQESINYSTGYNVGSFEEIFPVSWLNYQNKLMPNQGVALVQNVGNTSVKFKVIANGGAGAPIVEKYTKTWGAPTYTYGDHRRGYRVGRVPLKYLSGDFNGDGLSDAIAIENTYRSGSDKGKAHFINLDRRLPASNFVLDIGKLLAGLADKDKFNALDVNGDGKTNIVHIKEGHVYIYGLNHANNRLELIGQKASPSLKPEFPILPGDYNGDGKIDFLIPTANNSKDFMLFLATGKGFDVKAYKNQNFTYKTNYMDNQRITYSYRLVPIDINGDGKTDLIEYKSITYDNSNNGTQEIKLHINSPNYSYNNDIPKFSTSREPIRTTGNLKQYPIPIFLSSNQENGGLDFATISHKWVRSYKSIYDHREDVTLNKINNNGLSTTITYDRVAPDDNASLYHTYTPAYDQAYPFVNVNTASSFKVVKELEQKGSDLRRKQRFYYEGAVSHMSGLGFMGFNVLKRSNWYGDDVPALWTISKHDPLLRGAITEQITSVYHTTNPNTYVSKVNYFYDYELISNPNPASSQYTTFYTRNTTVNKPQIDEAEKYIKYLPGFHATGSNATYTGHVYPKGRNCPRDYT